MQAMLKVYIYGCIIWMIIEIIRRRGRSDENFCHQWGSEINKFNDLRRRKEKDIFVEITNHDNNEQSICGKKKSGCNKQ